MNVKRIACLLSISLCLSFGAGTRAKAAVNPERIWGANRYDTSVSISRNGWNATSDYAVVVSGEGFGDALSAAPLAKKYNAPILLVSKDKLDNQSDSNLNISEELSRLKVKKVFLIGGTGVVSTNVENTVKNKGIEVERISGADRYATSVEVAKKVGTDNGIVVATGEDFPDALSIAPIAATKGMPIILVPKNNITPELKGYIDSNNKISKTYVIGSNDVVSDEVSKQFPNVERILGEDEYKRNLNIVDKFSKDLHLDTVYVASRSGFADSLSGSALAALTSSPIILVGDNSKNYAQDYFKNNLNNIGQVNVLGGEGVVKTAQLQSLLPISTTSQAINGGLLKASLNQQNITSMQSDSNIGLNVSATGLPEEAQQVADKIVPVINNSKLALNIKMNGNSDKTISNVQEDITLQVAGMNIQTTAWVSVDFSGGQTKMKEIVKIPALAAPYLPPQFANKQYMVIDPLEMSSQLGGGTANFNGFMNFSKNFQPEFQKFMEKYLENYNPGFSFINYKGLTRMNTKEGIKYAQTYELKLNDLTFKSLLNYTANDFVKNKDLSNFVKQFIISCIDLSGAPDKDAQKQEIQKAFDDMTANPQAAMQQIKFFMDTFKDLKIIGDKGIDITYNIYDGYIIGESGIVDLQIDINKFVEVVSKLSNNTAGASGQDAKGILGLGIIFDTQNYNINKDVKIEVPQLTDSNSFNYMDLIKLESSTQSKVLQTK